MGNNTEILEQTCGMCNESRYTGCRYENASEALKKDTLAWLCKLFDVKADIRDYANLTVA